MKTLFIDTHDAILTVALLIDDKLNKKEVESINSHSTVMIPLLDSLLKEENMECKDIDRIVVVNGPGSFTGIRIGLTVAKILGYALNIPVYPISSLKAYLVSSDIKEDKMCVIPDTKGYYISAFDKNNKEILEEQYVDDFSTFKYKKVRNELDINKICEYVSDDELINVNLLKANYVKKIGVGND